MLMHNLDDGLPNSRLCYGAHRDDEQLYSCRVGSSAHSQDNVEIEMHEDGLQAQSGGQELGMSIYYVD